MSDGGAGIEGMRNDSAFARWIAEALQEPFKLVDVGAAGGVAQGWRVFGEKLAAIGYEADPEEVARLNSAEANPAVRYVAGLVGLPADHPLTKRLADRHRHHAWVGGRLSYERSRALRAARQAGQPTDAVEEYVAQVAAGPSPLPPEDGYDLDYASIFSLRDVTPSPSDPTIFLPAHLQENGFCDPDFIKIDVDGADFEILRSCTELLDQGGLLGVALEVSYFGSHDANDNSFHNMDRLMRQKGFSLFGLTVRHYSSAALPSPFMDRHPGATFKGRPFQGDAVYLRDLASPFWRKTAAAVSEDRLLKLSALFSLLDLPDQAAELLLAQRERLQKRIDISAGLEHLTIQSQAPWPEGMAYRDWIAAFESDNPYFYDVYGRQETWLAGLLQTQAEAPAREAALRARIEEVEQAFARSQATLERLRSDAKHLIDSETTLRAIQASRMWRMSEPLRRVLNSLRASFDGTRRS